MRSQGTLHPKTELIMDRTNADIHALRAAYSLYGARKDKYTLDALVAGELSGRTQSMFSIALAANRNESDIPNPHAPVPLQPPSLADVERDAHIITSFRSGHDQGPLCSIVLNSSKTHLNAITQYIRERKMKILPQHHALRDFISNTFNGHVKDALIYVVEGCLFTRDPSGQLFVGVERDAERLALTMKGNGTKGSELAYRLIRAHWNRPRFEAIKAVYPRFDDQHQTLLARVGCFKLYGGRISGAKCTHSGEQRNQRILWQSSVHDCRRVTHPTWVLCDQF